MVNSNKIRYRWAKQTEQKDLFNNYIMFNKFHLRPNIAKKVYDLDLQPRCIFSCFIRNSILIHTA